MSPVARHLYMDGDGCIPGAVGRKTLPVFQKSQKGDALLLHLQILGFQEARSGATGGQNSSWDKMRMGLWNNSHHSLETVLQPKDHELMLLSCLQISPVLWTLPVVVCLRSFGWEMTQKLFLQPGIAGGEGSVQDAVP